MLEDAFLGFLAGLLGFEEGNFQTEQGLWIYGVDSLSGVSCQYWFHRGKLWSSPLSSSIFSCFQCLSFLTFSLSTAYRHLFYITLALVNAALCEYLSV